MDFKFEMPIRGLACVQLKPFIKLAKLLMPVYEPGPLPNAKKSISLILISEFMPTEFKRLFQFGRSILE